MKKVLLPLLILIAASSFLMAVESSPSAIVGYVKYPCVTTAGGLNMIALPMNSGYAMASDLDTAFPDMLSSISYWDASSQSWVEADYGGPGFWPGDFDVHVGDPLFVYANSDFDFYSMGSLPSPASYPLIVGLDMMMVPLNKSALTTAGAVGDDSGIMDAISYWDAPSQSWVEADYGGPGFWPGDFDVTIGEPLFVYANSVGTYPNAKSVKTLKASRASK
jgi:hypothetical protein